MRIASAISMIRDHGNFAAVTCDGLLATATVVDTNRDEDRVFEEPIVFEVDDEDQVCGNSIRAWLGY